MTENKPKEFWIAKRTFDDEGVPRRIGFDYETKSNMGACR
jgi:hypothetical protein